MKKRFVKRLLCVTLAAMTTLGLTACTAEDVTKNIGSAVTSELDGAAEKIDDAVKDNGVTSADLDKASDALNEAADKIGDVLEKNGIEKDDSIETLDAMELKSEWKQDRVYQLVDPTPWNLEELKEVVDVADPGSVAAYWVWAVTRLTDDYDDGMEMMKYLFADIEPFGSGYTEGGVSGQAGWDSYFNERLNDSNYSWLPRAYFDGCTKENGYTPSRPRSIELYYNDTNTETINAQTFESLGRLNIVYWVQSYAGGNQVNIELSRFEGTNRWYVTNGASSAALFYQQPAGNGTKDIPNDDSTQAQHDAAYGH